MADILNVKLTFTEEEKQKIVNECIDIMNERLISELEKIKAEIQILSFFSRSYNMQMVEMSNVVERIDNHISELKGENNE